MISAVDVIPNAQHLYLAWLSKTQLKTVPPLHTIAVGSSELWQLTKKVAKKLLSDFFLKFCNGFISVIQQNLLF